MRRPVYLAALLAGCHGSAPGSDAGIDAGTQPIAIIDNPDPHVGDRFGARLVPAGDRLVVASNEDHEDVGRRAGGAWLYDGLTSALIARLPDTDAAPERRYGSEVVVRGDLALVSGYRDVEAFDAITGAPRYTMDTSPGPIPRVVPVGDNVLQMTQWTSAPDLWNLRDGTSGEVIAEIVPPDNGEGYVTEYTAAVGEVFALGDSYADGGDGTVYLHDGNTGALLREVPNPDPTTDSFGWRIVAVAGNLAVLSYENEDSGRLDLLDATGELITSMPNTGRVMPVGNNFLSALAAEEVDTITELWELRDGTTGAAIATVALSPRIVDFGAVFATLPSWELDAPQVVQIRDSATGDILHSLTNDDPDSGFGIAVAVSDDRVMVSGRDHLFVYDRETGALLDDITAPMAGQNADFGRSVITLGGRFVVSAATSDVDGLEAVGRVYVYE